MSGPSARHGSADRPGDRPERLYVITNGRSRHHSPTALDVVTLVVSRARARSGTQPEHAAILRMCRYPLSVAEVSAYLGLPVSATAVLVADLLADGLVEVRQPVRTAGPLPDPEILKAVLDGIEQL